MLINILSNVWFNFILTETQANRNANDQLLDLKKLQEVYGFTKIINFDNDFKFWWMDNEEYIQEIQANIDNNNLEKIERKFRSYLKMIEKSLNGQTPESNLLFISINTNQLLYLFHLYIYIKHTGISKDNRDMTIAIINIIKNKYPFEINITDEKLKSLIF